jgi:sulfonate transport system substrate-binding protein
MGKPAAPSASFSLLSEKIITVFLSFASCLVVRELDEPDTGRNPRFVASTYFQLGLTLLLTLCAFQAWAEDRVSEVRLDYAYYSPASLVLRRFGWLEEEFRSEGTAVRWVFSQGSNRSLEYLNSGSIDFASTAGLAALLSRANGNPVKSIYVFSRPEWTALVVSKDSPVRSLADLRGKKIAATKGTDPFLFLLRALHASGLGKDDVQIVHLQHPDGRIALERGTVDAWAGLDPHMAASELENGSRLIYRNIDFNTYGFLNTSDNFLGKHPGHVRRTLAAYEKARRWILANPANAARILAEESKLPLAVAQRQLDRTDFTHPLPAREHAEALRAAAPILAQENLVRKNASIGKAIDELLDSGPALATAGALSRKD